MCPFSTERGKKVGHSEAPKRPRFPGWPRKGFQPSGSYPRATDNSQICWKKGKDLDFTKDPRPLYYKTPPCAFYHKNLRGEAVVGP